MDRPLSCQVELIMACLPVIHNWLTRHGQSWPCSLDLMCREVVVAWWPESRRMLYFTGIISRRGTKEQVYTTTLHDKESNRALYWQYNYFLQDLNSRTDFFRHKFHVQPQEKVLDFSTMLTHPSCLPNTVTFPRYISRRHLQNVQLANSSTFSEELLLPPLVVTCKYPLIHSPPVDCL